MGWPPCAFGKGFVPAIVIEACGGRVSKYLVKGLSECAYRMQLYCSSKWPCHYCATSRPPLQCCLVD
jgi:hypothetical protein